MKVHSAWDITTGDDSVVVAVIDSGVDIKHEDLKENIWFNVNEIPGDNIDNDNNGYTDDIHGWDFIQDNNIPSPKVKNSENDNVLGISHGTIVAGIIAAKGNNNVGISGLSWHSRIMSLRVLDQNGIGRTSDVVKAIDYAVDNGANIINLSFAGIGHSELIKEAIYRAYSYGVIVVAPAGNIYSGDPFDLDDTNFTPICADKDTNRRMVIGVASTDTLDQKTSFSNYGSKCVDISAPGTGFYAPLYQDSGLGLIEKYGGPFSGTSLSAPLITGSLALIKSYNYHLSNDDIIEILFASSRNIDDLNPQYKNKLGRGIVDLNKALLLTKEWFGEPNNPVDNTYRPALIAVSPNNSYTSDIKTVLLYKKYAHIKESINTFPFNFSKGLNVLPTKDYYIAAPAKGGGPQLLFIDKEKQISKSFFVHDKDYRGGISFARGNLFNPYQNDLVVGLGADAKPIIKVMNENGDLLLDFLAYSENYNKGVNVALGDLNGDEVDEIVTGTMTGGGPQVMVFTANGKLVLQFFAFDEKSRYGVNVTTGDVDGDGIDEIIAAQGGNSTPLVKIFDNKGNIINEFYAYNKNLNSGLSIQGVDVDNDGIDEVLTAIDAKISPQVNLYSNDGLLRYSFNAFTQKDYPGGLNIKVQK